MVTHNNGLLGPIRFHTARFAVSLGEIEDGIGVLNQVKDDLDGGDRGSLLAAILNMTFDPEITESEVEKALMGKAARIKYLKPELTKSLIKLMKNYKKTQSHPLRLKPLNVEQQAPSRHSWSNNQLAEESSEFHHMANYSTGQCSPADSFLPSTSEMTTNSPSLGLGEHPLSTMPRDVYNQPSCMTASKRNVVGYRGSQSIISQLQQPKSSPIPPGRPWTLKEGGINHQPCDPYRALVDQSAGYSTPAERDNVHLVPTLPSVRSVEGDPADMMQLGSEDLTLLGCQELENGGTSGLPGHGAHGQDFQMYERDELYEEYDDSLWCAERNKLSVGGNHEKINGGEVLLHKVGKNCVMVAVKNMKRNRFILPKPTKKDDDKVGMDSLKPQEGRLTSESDVKPSKRSKPKGGRIDVVSLCGGKKARRKVRDKPKRKGAKPSRVGRPEGTDWVKQFEPKGISGYGLFDYSPLDESTEAVNSGSSLEWNKCYLNTAEYCKTEPEHLNHNRLNTRRWADEDCKVMGNDLEERAREMRDAKERVLQRKTVNSGMQSSKQFAVVPRKGKDEGVSVLEERGEVSDDSDALIIDEDAPRGCGDQAISIPNSPPMDVDPDDDYSVIKLVETSHSNRELLPPIRNGDRETPNINTDGTKYHEGYGEEGRHHGSRENNRAIDRNWSCNCSSADTDVDHSHCWEENTDDYHVDDGHAVRGSGCCSKRLKEATTQPLIQCCFQQGYQKRTTCQTDSLQYQLQSHVTYEPPKPCQNTGFFTSTRSINLQKSAKSFMDIAQVESYDRLANSGKGVYHTETDSRSTMTGAVSAEDDTPQSSSKSFVMDSRQPNSDSFLYNLLNSYRMPEERREQDWLSAMSHKRSRSKGKDRVRRSKRQRRVKVTEDYE
ncbi:uncharacterized protein [Apostichopus japonicus]|uniref:uncharacterized protein isoform X2 n=1 Tax=Stichopus japonicus TaxID=307972 RepID=UPI003AB39CA3